MCVVNCWQWIVVVFLWKWNKNKDLNSFKSSFHMFLEMGGSDNRDDKIKFITQISVIYMTYLFTHEVRQKRTNFKTMSNYDRSS